MDKSMWQTLGAFDLVYSSYKWIPAMLSCGKHSTTMQTWIVARLDFAKDLEDSKSISGRILCIFGSHTFVPISWMCKKQTFSFTQFYGRYIDLSRCRFTHGWISRSRSLGFGDWSIWKTRQQSPSQTCIAPSQSSTPTSFQQTLITFHQIQQIPVPVLCCVSLRTMRQSECLLLKDQRANFPESLKTMFRMKKRRQDTHSQDTFV